jgi:cellulose synthase/poly-beta-1,6-N-acetylglucosamine synthase-like glycosyltransferase
MERQYDAVCVFDADNLVHPDFLREMNSRLCKGERLIQGYLDSKNPNDTWISGVFSISFWVVNHVWHLAKYNIGLSSCLGGTGMCISTDILRRHGWGATCLTEDMEFTMKALLKVYLLLGHMMPSSMMKSLLLLCNPGINVNVGLKGILM